MATHSDSAKLAECADIHFDVETIPKWRNTAHEYGVFENMEPNGTARFLRLERHDLSGVLEARDGRYKGQFVANGDSRIPLYTLIRSGLSFLCEDKGDILLHASGVSRGGRLWLFSGPTGSGKSTIAAGLNGGGKIFSQDQVVICATSSGGIGAHTTPFSDDDDLIQPAYSERIAGLAFIEQAPMHRLIEIGVHEKVRRILAQTVAYSRTPDKVNQVVETVGKIVENLDCFVLKFARDDGFWDLLDRRL